MMVFEGQMSKQVIVRLRWTLALVGTLVLIVGVALTATPAPLPSTVMPASHLLADGVTSISPDSCIVCHRDGHGDEPLQPMVIQNARAAAAPVLTAVESVSRPVEMGSATTPYMAGTLSRHDPQRYLMQTAEGFAILPGVWNRAVEAWVQQNPDGWPGECAGCHEGALDVGASLPAAAPRWTASQPPRMNRLLLMKPMTTLGL